MKHSIFKKLGLLVAVLLTAALLTSALGPASAAESRTAYNQAGVWVFGRQLVQPGEWSTAPNGQKVPSVITYTDAAGGKTNYISVRQLEGMLDAEIGWNAKTGSVEIPRQPTAEETKAAIREEGTHITIQEGTADPAGAYGTVNGPFEEVDPAVLEELDYDEAFPPVNIMSEARIQQPAYACFPDISVHAVPEHGQYLVWTLTNHGTTEQEMRARRMVTIASGRAEAFPDAAVAPGETVTRVFRISEGETRLKYDLTLGFGTREWEDSDVTVSITQYTVKA